MPTYIEPCLPKLVELAPTGERWIHEIKHDGYRLAVRIEAGDVRLLSRRGLNWTSRFPLVDQAARALRQKSVYIDGEVVSDGPDGISNWPPLHACASAGRCPDASLWAFDLLFLGGKDLRALPARRANENARRDRCPSYRAESAMSSFWRATVVPSSSTRALSGSRGSSQNFATAATDPGNPTPGGKRNANNEVNSLSPVSSPIAAINAASARLSLPS